MVKVGFIGAFLAIASIATATPAEFSAASGNRAAWALFETQGDKLVVTLANTSAYDVLAPQDVLTAIFFNSTLPLSLEAGSAIVPDGSTVLFGKTERGGAVGGEWGYADDLAGAPGGRTYGISSTGLDLFGPKDVFPGVNLQGPEGLDGLQYGIVSSADDRLTGNAAVTGKSALIEDRVVFTLYGLPSGFDPSLVISDVYFQYGTSLSEGGIGPPPSVPEPRTLALFALTGFLIVRRRLG